MVCTDAAGGRLERRDKLTVLAMERSKSTP